ncbi:hypothetical protein OROGR_021516 [Orobanche gracilis]
MTSFQARSNSLPSQSHPVINDVEDHLNKLRKASRATSTSSICASLASLRDLHEGINSIVRMPSTIRQAIAHEKDETWMNELLEESIGLVDLCGFSRDIVQLTKESIQELESSVRRNKVETTTSAGGINLYVASRKKINKMVGKRLKNISNNANQNPPGLPQIGIILNEAKSLGLSIMKSLLIFLSGEKERSSGRGWPLLSNFTQRKRVSEVKQESRFEDLCFVNVQHSTKNVDAKSMLVQLKTSEMSIHNIEEGLEALFRSLVKTRVALLNALSHD